MQGLVLATEFSRAKAVRYYEKIVRIKERRKAILQGGKASEGKDRDNAALLIQRVFRGRSSRKKTAIYKELQIKTMYSIVVQTEYRRRLAMFGLKALKRDKFNETRYFFVSYFVKRPSSQ